MKASVRAWRCKACGYVHREPNPPDFCPVCGAAKKDFEPFEGPASPPARAPADRWKCLNCDHVHEGLEPPDACPVCGAKADRFEPLPKAARAGGAAGRRIRAVIVGAGIAGIAAAEALRGAAPDARITILSKEICPPYYRLNLTRYLAGEIAAGDLPIHPADWYEQQGMDLRLGAEVSSIRLAEREVELHDGGKLPYDKLILAAGAHAFVPALTGAQREGVVTLRTIEDADRILRAARRGAKCVLIGGGILGLEAAGGLARRGADVTVLEGFGYLLPRQLNRKAGELLGRFVAGLGIRVLGGVKVAEIVGDERARGVLLEDKRTVPADLVVVTAGVRPNSCLARMAGLQVNQGVIVDDALTTSNPNVLAAGDVAEHRGVLYGIWTAAHYQGSIAGMVAAGLTAEFGGIPRSNMLKVLGLDLFSVGKVEADDASYIAVESEDGGRYYRFLFRDGRMVGAILLGDTSRSAALKKAIEDKADFTGLLAKNPSVADALDFLAADR